MVSNSGERSHLQQEQRHFLNNDRGRSPGVLRWAVLQMEVGRVDALGVEAPQVSADQQRHGLIAAHQGVASVSQLSDFDFLVRAEGAVH